MQTEAGLRKWTEECEMKGEGMRRKWLGRREGTEEGEALRLQRAVKPEGEERLVQSLNQLSFLTGPHASLEWFPCLHHATPCYTTIPVSSSFSIIYIIFPGAFLDTLGHAIIKFNDSPFLSVSHLNVPTPDITV